MRRATFADSPSIQFFHPRFRRPAAAVPASSISRASTSYCTTPTEPLRSTPQLIFPAGQDSLTVDLTVKLLDNAPSTGEPMSLDLGYLNSAGVVVFQGGPVSVTAAPPATPGTPNPPVKVPVTYTGPGASAVAVAISPRSLTVNAGGTFSFTAVAKDASGNMLPRADHLELTRSGHRDDHISGRRQRRRRIDARHRTHRRAALLRRIGHSSR